MNIAGIAASMGRNWLRNEYCPVFSKKMFNLFNGMGGKFYLFPEVLSDLI